MTALETVQLANSGVLLWTVVGPLLQQAMQNGVDVSIEDVEAASKELGTDLDRLHVAIELKKIRDSKAN
jgi:hypothetical protein